MTELKLLSEEERALARESGRRLAQLKNEDRPLRMKLADGEQELEIEVPALAKRTLIDALTALGDGKFVTIVPQNSELTTVQAASYLNVSRPYLIGLLDKGEIEYRKVGTHRRIKYTSLKKYKEEDLSRRKSVLDELASEAQELNLE